VFEPPLSARLAVLVAESREIAAHSAFLVRRARALCGQSTEERDERQVQQSHRQAWADLLAPLPGDPDHVVVLCAWCGRVKGVRLWHHLPVGIEYELRAWDRILLSHGYCPDCMRAAEPDWSATHAEPQVHGSARSA
jgi:hypothetical protein